MNATQAVPAVECLGLTKCYAASVAATPALNDLTLRIAVRESWVPLGENGIARPVRVTLDGCGWSRADHRAPG